VLGGGNCGIYKGPYNVSDISYLNSPPPPLSFIPLPPFMEQFQQVSFLHLHNEYTLFVPYSSFYPFPTPLTPSGQNLFHPLVIQFCKRKNLKDKKGNMAFLLV
jgi:hypothetical protein